MNIPKNLTFHAVLENSVELYSDRPALSFVGKEPLTYGDVNLLVERLKSLLLAQGVKHGDRVALLSQNMPNWGVAYIAVTSMGAVIVPILTDFSTPEIVKILTHSEAKTIIISEKQADKVRQELPETLQAAILLDDLSEISLGSLELSGTISPATTRELNANAAVTLPREEDLAAILYTSGTTGTPKGVMLSHRNLLSNAVNTLGIQIVSVEDRLLSVLPLPHTYECTIGFLIPFMTGASVYYLDKLPTPAVLLPAMEKVKPTMMLTVPLIIEKVYQNRVLPKLTGSSVMRTLGKFKPARKFFHKMAGKKIYKAFGGKLHFFGIGGAKLNAATELFLRDAGFPYAIGYGLTETSPLLAGCGPKLTKYRSTGFNLPNQEIKILNPDPHTGEGEIIAKGPNVMMGYYKEPELTQEVFTDDGWFKTGDLGSFDEDGYLFIKGRLKNIIISATGENIYPEDIEAVINSEHQVLESLVYEIKGKLVARIHLNYEEIDQRYHELKTKAEKGYQELKESAGQSYQGIRESAGQSYQDMKDSAEHMYEQAQQKVLDRLNEIKQRVNERLNRFSKVAIVEEQDEPFEKTPTKKIKRFLYQQQKER
jgi:long-chain acyl-CoA synthetase